MSHSKKLLAKKNKTRFAGIPHYVLDHKGFIELSSSAIKLLLEAARQYNGHNNGKLCFVWSQMSARGWKSKTTLSKAKQELITKGFLVVSKHGGFYCGKGQAQFYALTFQSINENPSIDMEIAPTNKPLNSFMN